MLFVDEAIIHVQSGKGGDGCVSFRREKYVNKGGPDGGDGGTGGSIFVVADPHVSTLVDLSGHHHWNARPGQAGSGGNCSGAAAEDVEIHVPVGTLVYDRNSGALLRDLSTDDARVCVARGGRGGRGNGRFATPTHQTPRTFEKGEPGEERWLRMELKLIADVGLVGLPNAGKSTLLSRISRARPKIADYPFTTLVPSLGIVALSGYRRFVVADLPGLIEGAHEGVGLGQTFLRHIERTRLILHLIDLFPSEGQPDPVTAYRMIRRELEAYSPKLAGKRELIVANKLDLALEDTPEELTQLQEALGVEVHAISGVSGQGLDALTNRIWQLLEEERAVLPELDVSSRG